MKSSSKQKMLSFIKLNLVKDNFNTLGFGYPNELNPAKSIKNKTKKTCTTKKKQHTLEIR